MDCFASRGLTAYLKAGLKVGLKVAGKLVGAYRAAQVGRAGGGVATATGGVYYLVNKAGVVKYVGSTCDFLRRAKEHGKFMLEHGLKVVCFADAGDPKMRLVIGQCAIEMFGGPKGGQLLSKINALATNNQLYKEVIRVKKGKM